MWEQGLKMKTVAKAKKVMQQGMGEIRNPQRRNLMYFV